MPRCFSAFTLALAAQIINLSVTQPAKGDSFVNTGSMTTNHVNHTATLLLDGKVLVAGGSLSYSFAMDVAELYDPATGTWTATAPMNSARSTHAAIRLANGQVLVVAGRDIGNYPLSSAELYNPVTRTWTNTGSLSTSRDDFTATLLTNGKVLVAGGYHFPSGEVASAELYDPATGVWTNTGSMTTNRSSHVATLLYSGKLLVAGGTSAEVYDPATETWTATGARTTYYSDYAILLKNGKVLNMGNTKAELYDPTTGTWTATGSYGMGNDKFAHCPPTLLSSGKVLVAGGNYSFFTAGINIYYPYSQLFDPATGLWTTNGTLNVARSNHAATLLKDGRLLITGGVGKQVGGAEDSLFLASAELYGPDSNTGQGIIMSVKSKATSGGFQFTFTSTPGGTNLVLSTRNVSVPLINWASLGAATEISPGHFQFTDPQATNGGRRFFSIRSF